MTQGREEELKHAIANNLPINLLEPEKVRILLKMSWEGSKYYYFQYGCSFALHYLLGKTSTYKRKDWSRIERKIHKILGDLEDYIDTSTIYLPDKYRDIEDYNYILNGDSRN